jgi:hypothetical protein
MSAQFNCYINDFNGLLKEFVTNSWENAWLAFIETQLSALYIALQQSGGNFSLPYNARYLA